MDTVSLVLYVIGVVVIVIALILATHSLTRPSGLPPGPMSLPFIGSIQAIIGDQRTIVPELRKKHGDVFSFYVGNQLFIVIAGMRAVQDAFRQFKSEFAESAPAFIKHFAHGNNATNTEDTPVSGHFRTAHRILVEGKLQEFGVDNLDARIRNEVDVFVRNLHQTQSKSTDVSGVLNQCAHNIIFSIIASHRYTHEDEEFKRFCEAIDAISKTTDTNYCGSNKSWITNSVFHRADNSHMADNCVAVLDVINKHLDEHRRSFVPEDIRDFIDSYLYEIDDQKDNPDSVYKDSFMPLVMVNLFLEGTKSISSTLQWSFLYLALQKDIQSKVQNELDFVVGREKVVSLPDRPQLPFLEATLLEIQRLANIRCFTPPHVVKKEVVFMGHVIPKDTQLLLMMGDVHTNVRQWKQPHVFNPDRFLPDGTIQIEADTFMPFGMGSRRCPCRHLAAMEHFLFVASVLQSFSIRIPGGISVQKEYGPPELTTMPEQLKLCFVPRS